MSVREELQRLIDSVDPSQDEDTAAVRILLVLTGALLVQMSFRIWAGLVPGPSAAAGVVAILLLMVTGVQLWIFAATALDMRVWGRAVGYATLLAVLLAAAIALFWTGDAWLPPLTTDESAFLTYAADLVLQGKNPYAHPMLPALEYPGSVDWATPRVDGQLSDRLIYPAGAVLAFVPARAVGLEIRVVAWGAALVLGAVTIAAVPPRWAIAPVAALLGARNVFLLGAMGDFDVLWLLPLVAAFLLRLDERWLAAGLAFGVACSVKQIPWLIAPFLVIQHYRMGGAAWRGVLRGMAAGAAVFAALNLPFFLADPGVWVRNIITPVGQTLPKVPQGVGITLLSYVGIYPLSTTWHTAALATVAGILALATWWYPHRVSHAVWLFPMPLLFVRLRSFASYFGSFTVLVLLATMAQFGLVRWSLPDPRELWRPRSDTASEPVVSDD